MPRLGITITINATEIYFKEQINNELNNYLECIMKEWGNKYNIKREYLDSKYDMNWIELQVEKIQTKYRKRERERENKEYYKLMQNSKLLREGRCCARIWTNPPFVFYNEEKEEWILGMQCERRQKEDGLCGIHLRNLPHGKIYEDPPHNKFERYKHKHKQK